MKKNNEYIYIGEIINTFGIKGELKILSKKDLQKAKAYFLKLVKNIKNIK